MAIGFAKATKFLLTERLTDPEGRYLFLKGNLGDKTFTLANVYCPNKNPITFLNQILGRLMDFKTGEVILAGDFNFCLNPSLDSTSRARGMNEAVLKRIGCRLHQCQLMDVWRVQHSDKHDFTFFSPVHGTYLRLDYIMVDHRLLKMVRDTKIEISTLSDHSSVLMG